MNSIKIALADDHTMIREALIGLINKNPRFNVILQAGNGAKLIKQLENSSPLPELCIIDINMPVMNGYNTCIELKKKWPDIRLLAISFDTTDFGISQMIHEGATGFILKHASVDELYTALERVYAGGMYLPEGYVYNNPNIIFRNLKISKSQQEFMRWCITGLAYKEIAAQMHLSVRTIEEYSSSLLKKFGLKSRTDLANYAIRSGLTAPEVCES